MLINEIKQTLLEYRQYFPEDGNTINNLFTLIEKGAEVTSRKEFQGHITCGAVVVNSNRKLLMIHHLALDKWLFPGGHLEAEDTTLRTTALRELAEETGIHETSLLNFSDWKDACPIHIDCHLIPENPKKSESEHLHWDFRYAFKGDFDALSLQKEEVLGWEWADIEKVSLNLKRRLIELALV